MNPNPRLWEYRWVRDLCVLLIVAMLLVAAYSVRAIVAPVLIGLVLAYVFNPLVTWAETRCKVPRWLTTTMLMLVGITVVGGLLVFIVPELVNQIQHLITAVSGYAETIGKTLGLDWEQATKIATDSLVANGEQGAATPLADIDLRSVGMFVIGVLGFGIGLINSTINLTFYMGLAVVVIAFCFFNFSWKFENIVAWFGTFIPTAVHEQTVAILGRMDRTVSSFVRGRLVQALVMGLVLSTGWWWFTVPYWLLLGMLSGMLNLAPFAASIGWLIATTLAVVDHATVHDGFQFTVVLWPTVVFLAAQSLDGWVVEPLVQGKATDLDPLTVLLAVLIGGALGGLIGLIIAIPVTACVKILSEQVILPKLRAAAQSPKTG